MSEKSAVEKVVAQLEKELARHYTAGNAVTREGNKIIIPEWMNYRDAASTILQHDKAMEEEIQTLVEYEGHPNDCLVAFYQSLKDSFGELLGKSVETFFGTIPGKSISVAVDYNETVLVPIGESQIPGLPITMKVQPVFDEDHESGGMLRVVFTYRRKFDPLVKRIEAMSKERLKNSSIFKGKAFDSKFNFMNVRNFDETRVVYSAVERTQIDANILSPITRTQQWLHNGSSLKRGVLLHGPYGTGKTLTARVTAKRCLENGWTFINVLPGDDIVRCLRFAARYQPSVVFFEDIDSTTGSDRTDRVNEILNTIDGVLSKDTQVVTVLTTNHIESVNRAMLRPGRLDSVIKLGELDKEAVVELLRACSRNAAGESILEGELDEEPIWDASRGYVPAFIVESVVKAKAYALARNGHGELKITSKDIENALRELRPQWDLMNIKPDAKNDSIETSINGIVEKVVDDRVSSLHDLIDSLDDYVRDRM